MRTLSRLAPFLISLALMACPVIARAEVMVSPAHVTPQASTAAETAHVVNVAGLGASLHGASITTGATAGFFMILAAAADPGNGTLTVGTVKKCIQVAAQSTAALSADPDTMWDFPAGVVLLFSTTGCLTETQSATAWFSWQ